MAPPPIDKLLPNCSTFKKHLGIPSSQVGPVKDVRSQSQVNVFHSWMHSPPFEHDSIVHRLSSSVHTNV